MKALQRPMLLAGLVFFLVYLLPLGIRPLFIPDETRYAEIAREMIAHGDWVVPHLNGLDYFEKPALGYWMYALAQLLFGATRFAVRFPSALAAGLSAALLFLFCRIPARSMPGQRLGALAALIFLSTLTVAGIGTFAVLDTLLTLFLTLTLVAFFLATEAGRASRQESFWLLVAGFGCGLAFLTKGFLALAIPALVIVPFLLWQGRWRDLLRMAWLPLLTAFLVSLPWSLLIHQRAPDFWNFFFWNEHVKRFFSGQAQHAEPAWYFLVLLPIMALPWSFLLGSVWQGARSKQTPASGERALVRFALCWLVLPLLFFSASSGKIATYILPCFPAIAVLLACGLDRFATTGKQRSFNIGTMLAAGFFGLILITLQVAQLVGYQGAPVYSSLLPWLGGSLALALTVAVYLVTLRISNHWQKILLFALAPIPLLCFVPNMMPDLTLAKKDPVTFLEQLSPQLKPTDIILADVGMAPAICWSQKRDDIYLLQNKGELAYGVEQPNGMARFLTLELAGKIIAEYPGRVVIIAKQKQAREWLEQLPPPMDLSENHAQGFVALRF